MVPKHVYYEAKRKHNDSVDHFSHVGSMFKKGFVQGQVLLCFLFTSLHIQMNLYENQSYNWNQVQNASRPKVVEKPGERNLNKSKVCFHPSTRASKVGATWTSVRSVSGLLIRAWFWFALTTWAGRNEFCYHQADHQFVQLQLSIYLLSKQSSP